MTASTPPWWWTGIVYQVYPRSFQDSNGDGIGDLPGIIERLDYLAGLGIDAVWLSPIFPSPMTDFGYDVADFCDVEPIFGTLEDLDRLVEEAHARELRILLDFVPNHTSDQHPWFLAARSSRDDPHRDWYLWADPGPDGGPPNNWVAMFGGSAWTLDEATGQYYYHAFLPTQPDLNWRNPEVRDAMADVLRFWLDRGIDGFRVDVIWHLIKDEALRDNPPDPSHTPDRRAYRRLQPVFTTDRPEVFDVIGMMRSVVDAYDDRLLIGEIYLPLERLVAYYGEDGGGVHLPFNFSLVTSAWDARGLAELIDRYEGLLPEGAWPNWVLGNHDQPRIATRVGVEQARVAAMLLLTLRGTPTLYYGDEIGMRDVDIPAELRVDPAGDEGRSRDLARTPMQWRPGSGAGFTTGRPWLPIAPDADVVNVAVEEGDPRSMLTLHRRLIALRRAEPALTLGTYVPVAASGTILAFLRRHEKRLILVALNLGPEGGTVRMPEAVAEHEPRILLSTDLDREGPSTGRSIELRPNEGVIVGFGD